MTKSLPRKSAMVLGSLVRPHTKRRKRERSVLEKDSITSQNHWIRDAEGSIPLYVATDFKRCRGISGLPHTCRRTYCQGWVTLLTFHFSRESITLSTKACFREDVCESLSGQLGGQVPCVQVDVHLTLCSILVWDGAGGGGAAREGRAQAGNTHFSNMFSLHLPGMSVFQM